MYVEHNASPTCQFLSGTFFYRFESPISPKVSQRPKKSHLTLNTSFGTAHALHEWAPNGREGADALRGGLPLKTALGFLTEEGRTRSKNAARRISAYAVVMFLVAGVAGYAIHKYWVASSLTTLQRVYFKQYFKSSYRSYLSNSKSHYTTLARVVTDPRTKKDVSLAVVDDEIEAQIDENGRMKFDKRHYPIILLKAGIDHKQFSWQETMTPDTTAYQWFRNTIYEGESIP